MQIEAIEKHVAIVNQFHASFQGINNSNCIAENITSLSDLISKKNVQRNIPIYVLFHGLSVFNVCNSIERTIVQSDTA